MPLVIFYFNKGYLSANRYLAGFLFFSALYLLENFYFFYGKSLPLIAFFTNTHAFFYLIGPFAFFYMRSILRDNSKLSKTDYLHLVLFVISFIGYIPYFYSSWDYKLVIAQNIFGENWDMAPFHLNKFIPHKIDQGFNVLHTYFYSASLWYLLWYHKKVTNNPIIHIKQYKLIRNWLFTFTVLFSVITINFTVAMANVWLYDSKSVFLDRASDALLFASIVYVGMNMTVMIFPHIMYGLPIDMVFKPLGSSAIPLPEVDQLPVSENKASLQEDATNYAIKSESQLFTPQYIEKIETHLQERIEKQKYLESNCGLSKISDDVAIPAHHLTYYFNNIKKQSFSYWRNQLRIEHAKTLINQGATGALSLQGVAISSGFSSQSTFIRAFKNVTGSNPSEYLKNITK